MTSTPNYRKFCVQLIEALEQYEPLDPNDSDLITGIRACIQAETLLEAVGMEKELCNPLRLNGYTSVEQVLEADPADLMKSKGLGPDRVGRIFASLKKWQKAARERVERKAEAILDSYCTLADLRNREVSDSEMLAAAVREVINQCQNGQGMISAAELLRIAIQLDVAEDDIDLFQAQ